MTKEEVTCKNCSIPLEYHGPIEFYCARIEVLGREIDHAKKERDDARQDAARYQWLKGGGLYKLPSTEHGMGEEFDFREWDQLIDAHMKEETP